MTGAAGATCARGPRCAPTVWRMTHASSAVDVRLDLSQVQLLVEQGAIALADIDHRLGPRPTHDGLLDLRAQWASVVDRLDAAVRLRNV